MVMINKQQHKVICRLRPKSLLCLKYNQRRSSKMKKYIALLFSVFFVGTVQAGDGSKMVEQYKYEAQSKVQPTPTPTPNSYSNIKMHKKKTPYSNIKIHKKKTIKMGKPGGSISK